MRSSKHTSLNKSPRSGGMTGGMGSPKGENFSRKFSGYNKGAA